MPLVGGHDKNCGQQQQQACRFTPHHVTVHRKHKQEPFRSSALTGGLGVRLVESVRYAIPKVLLGSLVWGSALSTAL
jgi:hypothetical protein